VLPRFYHPNSKRHELEHEVREMMTKGSARAKFSPAWNFE
jgi:hypothetical protein